MRFQTHKLPRVLAAIVAAILVAAGATQLSALRGSNTSAATKAAGDAAPGAETLPAASIIPLTAGDGTTPADTATEVKFIVGHHDCVDTWWASGWGGWGTFNFYVGNTLVGTTQSTNGCTCNSTPLAFTVTDPAVLAQVNAPACTSLKVTSAGSDIYVAYVRVEITRTESPVENVCLFDALNSGTCGDRDTCQAVAHSPNGEFFVDVDADADGLPDCADADKDGDGVANAGDNCPADPNPGQSDSNGNGLGDACENGVVAVPWAGSEAKPHVVFSGGQLTLQAVASKGGDGEPIALQSATWDPGDGSGPQNISFSNSRVLEYTHTYSGADYQPYTATITVKDAAGNTYSDTMKVQIVPKTLDAEVNMAIDRGLWYEHKRMISKGKTVGYWPDDDALASTASTTQAFQVNGHRETGDRTKNPYVNNVYRGLRYLQQNIRRRSIGAQPGGDPDSNGNGYGLEYGGTNGHGYVYAGGQIIDAFIASATPNALVSTGTEVGRTYKDVVQDMLDTYSWGQYEDGTGGWVYEWNCNCGIDSSSSGWWAIGALGAEVWGLSPPAWVKQKNLDEGITSLQQWHMDYQAPGTGSHGACSYRNNGGDHSPTRTAACMLMMAADGVGRDHTRYAAAEAYIARNFNYGELHGNMYAMYNMAKAMRLAKAADGSSSPITLLGGTIDWYNLDKYPTNPMHGENGFARYLVGRQGGDGSWSSDGWVSGTTSTAWGILILSPALFEVGPTAACSVDSNIVCKAGTVGGCNPTGTNPYATVNFDGSQSTAGDNPIASYTWDFQDNTSASGVSASHQFLSLGTFSVKLTVADTKGITSSVTCPVQVVETALPPVADPGGPYAVCSTGKVVLDGSASYGRGANIISYEWDWSAPINFAAIDFNGPTPGDQTAVFTSQGPGTYDVALRVKDDSASGFVTTKYTTVTILSPNDPACVVKDRDNDGIDDPVDNCPDHANADQTDTDGDGQGNACDPDDDNDGVEDGADNCSLAANADQADNDSDGQGDVCDPDDDNDGFADGDDACQFVAGVASAQGCPDADGDTVQDSADNCPTVANTNQADNDADGQGDACDPDDDNDTLPDEIDPRPFNPNEAPSCSAAGPSIAQIWPPNHQLVPVTLVGATDVDGDVLTIVVESIFQDEPTNTQGDGNTAIDGYGLGTNTAQVRAERAGTPRAPGDGRVYHITFKVSDPLTSCTKTVTVGVPHDQGQRRIPVDQGPLYKSTGGQ